MGFDARGSDAYHDKLYLNSALTKEGEAQCVKLFETWKEKSGIQAVYSSPLKRALQTAQGVFRDMPLTITALDPLREYPSGLHWCNYRGDVSTLQHDFPLVDFGCIQGETDDYWKQDRYETQEELEKRVDRLIEHVRNSPHTKIAIFSHCSFLLALFKKSPPHSRLFKIASTEEPVMAHCTPYEFVLQ